MPTTGRTERIAIVGVGGIFPGALSLSRFWENVRDGVDSGQHVPSHRWQLNPHTALDVSGPRLDRVYSTWGCFIEGFQFDPSDLNLDPRLLARLDPLFHLGLHAARAALRDAKQLTNVDLSRVGVILGNIALPTESTSEICRVVLGRTLIERLLKAAPISRQRRETLNERFISQYRTHDWHPLNRLAASLPARLIAEGLNLGGVAYTLDAACASSLYALKFACEELRTHRADAMLAGGMSRPDCQYTQMGFAQLKALSRQGRCAPLSSAADGLVVGEGAGVFVLKRLSDAISAGDQIYGVISGIGLSNDRGANLLAPHSEGQIRAMNAAYLEAGWRASDIDLIECHATGTPVGDAVEIASLHQLWQHENSRAGQCVIGGVKSNVGHLLTGAGAAGLMKVLMALKHQVLPPTANFVSPADSLNQLNCPFRVLAKPEAWNRRISSDGTIVPRRATVNAFGFGGINAHLLVEEFLPAAQANVPDQWPVSIASKTASDPIEVAIIGYSYQVGGRASDNHVSDSSQLDWGVEQSEWYQRKFGTPGPDFDPITTIRLPLGQFRIPPVEMQEMLPQQQLMLKAAAAALQSSVKSTAGSASDSPAAIESGNRTGVFIGIELDPNTTNFHLRWSIEQHAAGWADGLGLELTSAELTEWTNQLKESVGPGLTANRVMGNLGGIVASRLAREFNIGGPSFTISSDENSGLRACEMALNSLRRGELDRAIVGAVDLPCDIRHRVCALCDSPLPHSKTTADGVTALVLKRLDAARRDGDPVFAVIRQVEPVENDIASDTVAIGAATGLVRLTSSLESIHHQILDEPSRQYWLSNRDDGPRTARINGCGLDGRNLAFELVEYENPAAPTRRESCLPAHILVIEGNRPDELAIGLQQLSVQAKSFDTIEQLARARYRQRHAKQDPEFAISLIVTSLDELPEVLGLAHARLQGRHQGAANDRRVYYSANPIGRSGQLAFVFPGSGNAFLGMGRELLATFPDVLRQQAAENSRLRDQYRPDLIWNANSTAELLSDHKSMIFGQVALGTAVCDLLALFKIRPAASLGYSLGESAALFGLRAWVDRDEMLQRMDHATLFGSDLVWPFNAARRAWQVSEDQEIDWVSGSIDRPASEIRFAIQRFGETNASAPVRVYLLIINSHTQCVIGGQRDQVLSLVSELGATFVPFAAPSTVHCEILRQVEPAYRDLHLMRTLAPLSLSFYSTAWGRSYELNQESAAEAIVAQAVDTIDFPRVVEQSYADGVRFFLEIGPGSSCTRLIDEILGDRVHFAQAALPVTGNPIGTFLELIAALIAERFPVDLGYLYGESNQQWTEREASSSRREIVTTTGGSPFEIPAPRSGWNIAKTVEEAIEVPGEHADPNGTRNGSATEQRNPSRDWIPNVIESSPRDSRELLSDIQLSENQKPVNVPIPAFHAWQESEQHKARIMMNQMDEMFAARNRAHEAYLRVSAEAQRIMAEQLALLAELPDLPEGYIHEARTSVESVDVIDRIPLERVPAMTFEGESDHGVESSFPTMNLAVPELPLPEPGPIPPRSLNRTQCMEFAIGKIGRALGSLFADIDKNPTRVRLPDEPLMLVDRILEIEGEPLSMTSGRVVTEHDIHTNAWYLDCNRIPTCIAVEAGQADLFLSGWLGIDFETKGLACYRLLDAVVTFHDGLPQPGETIHYNIRINHFFRQGQTYLFRFEFDSTVNGRPLLTMRDGCAGFFTEAELAGGKGIVHTSLDKQPRPGKRSADWKSLAPMSVERFDDQQLLSLRQGKLAECFGPLFANVSVANPVTIPGLSVNGERTRMWLIDRVLKLDPQGGKYGLGTILGELDIHPDDWFLTCHFCDDQVMPGTLMYECCLHTLRIFLLRMGWVGQTGQVVYEPIPGIRSRLKCRGQVRANTQKVWYEINLKEIGYVDTSSEPDRVGGSAPGTPYCLADALMYADGKPIVEITDMTIRLSGLTRSQLERVWTGSVSPAKVIAYDRRPAIFDTDRITAFAIGKPSDAFGERYKPFDADRTIARLPGPPFQFLDRIVDIRGCQPWILQAGGEIVAQYDVPPEAWYFAANRQRRMPFAVLLETALQPCGWLAAYVGSALTSETDLSFRNLGGSATQYADVTPDSGTLTTTVKMTRVSNSGGMIIQHYDFDLRCHGQPVYVGNTYFGFFSKASLANQIGIRDAKPFAPTSHELSSAWRQPYPNARPFADEQFQMIDEVDLSLDQGPAQLGYVIGRMKVKPETWFFKAHFYQDPVVPGSLGLESFFQLLKLYAFRRWRLDDRAQFVTPVTDGKSTNVDARHEWVYRGQVIPADDLVTVSAVITKVDDARCELSAEGFLSVDGRIIYQMKNFTLGVDRTPN